MQFKAFNFLALAATLSVVFADNSCNSGIDTTVGASCSTPNTDACANNNRAQVTCTDGTWQQVGETCKSGEVCIYCTCQGPGAGEPVPLPPKRPGWGP